MYMVYATKEKVRLVPMLVDHTHCLCLQWCTCMYCLTQILVQGTAYVYPMVGFDIQWSFYLKGHPLERTPLYKKHKFLSTSTFNMLNTCDAPSHQRTTL